jgi:hypothetical protein
MFCYSNLAVVLDSGTIFDESPMIGFKRRSG